MLLFQHPATILISGPSRAGKTCFVNKLLQHRNEMFNTHFNSITWCFGAVTPRLDVSDIHFVQGIPDMENFDIPSNSLLILDDLMSETNGDVANLFTKYAHHKNLTVIFIVQNLFPKGKHARDISLNAHYIIVFKNPRDKLQIQNLARQIMPRHSKDVVEVFEKATAKPHTYLLFDLTQSTPDALRIRTNIFPNETMYVYAHVKDMNNPILISR
jgi:GTPase SAR1 family protein